MDSEKIYLSMPRIAQEVLINFAGLRIKNRRYGKEYFQLEDEVIARRTLDGISLEGYQNQRLKITLSEAVHSNYWKKQFHDYSVNINSAYSIDELKKLPVLTKDIVKENIDGIFSSKYKKRDVIARHTSGTTGSGLFFYENQSCEQETWATWWRYRLQHGIDHSTLCGYFGGRSIVHLSQHKPPYWRMNRVGRQLMFSAYHLKEENALDYIKEITKKKIRWLHGYPSSISLLSKYILDQSIDTPPLVQTISFGAESLTIPQVETIKKAFPKAILIQHYGQAEGVANISQCTSGKLHVDEDFSLVEFIPVEYGINTYKMIGTNWINPIFPLLRYDTSDVVHISDQQCNCGSKWRIVDDIDGRIEDFVTIPGGVKVGRLDHIFKDMVNIVEAQVRQKECGSIQINVVKNKKYSEIDEKLLLVETRKRLGHEIKIRVSYVEKVPRTKSGKVRLVVSEL